MYILVYTTHAEMMTCECNFKLIIDLSAYFASLMIRLAVSSLRRNFLRAPYAKVTSFKGYIYYGEPKLIINSNDLQRLADGIFVLFIPY